MTYINLRDASGNPKPISGTRLRRLTTQLIRQLRQRDYLQEAFGYKCVDDGDVDGEYGSSFGEHLLLEADIEISDPVEDNLESVSDIEILAIHEVLFDIVSEGVKSEGVYHNFCNCGWHYRKFDPRPAQSYLVEQSNRYLSRFESGYQFNADGRLELLMGDLPAEIIGSPLPDNVPTRIEQRIEHAKATFRKGTSSWEDRRVAVLQLAAVCEEMRRGIGEHIGTQDENDLFNILNNFGLRHSGPRQKTGYDYAVFLTWIFYIQLATIHAVMRLRDRSG